MAATGSPLVFAVNGEKFELDPSQVDPTVTLNDFIRRNTRFKGTKLGCGEGGCGACAVHLQRVNPATGAQEGYSAHSCIRPLATMHGYAVTTTEGLGSKYGKDGFHPVQERIAHFNGTQCGFCTPGMVMATFSLLAKNPTATMKELEAGLDGNLCRCTGYRPILDAAKSFAADSNVTDHLNNGNFAATKVAEPALPSFLSGVKPVGHSFAGSGKKWQSVTTLDQLFAALEAAKGQKVKLIVAGTSYGVFKDTDYDLYVDVHNVPELQKLESTSDSITVGACNSITSFLEALHKAAGSASGATKDGLTAAAAHVQRVASNHIRNVGSVGGNVVMAKQWGFLSDLAMVLLAANATVTVASKAKTESMALSAFLGTNPAPLADGTVLLAVTMPFPSASTLLQTYKTSIRPINAVSLVNAGFQADVEASGNVKSAIVAFGGVGPTNMRFPATEAALAGPRSQDTLDKALAALATEAKALAHDRKGFDVDNTLSTISGLLYKFYVSLCLFAPPGGSAAGNVAPHNTSATLRSDIAVRAVSTGKQGYTKPEAGDGGAAPVFEPIKKYNAEAQASGEVQYVDDVADAQGTVFATFVVTPQASGTLESIDLSEAENMPGYVDFIGADKIPGTNNCAWAMSETVLLPLGSKINCAHEYVGVLVADTLRHAEAAAKKVKFNITAADGKPCILVEDAHARAIPPIDAVRTRGDILTGLEGAKKRVSGRAYCGTQKHFYMETQSAYAVPEEVGTMTLHVANQAPGLTHQRVASFLKLPQHHITVTSKRCGGGFGGKIIKQIPIACATALAAQVLQRPVKMMLNRNLDLEVIGGRHEVDAEYEVGFNDDGKITALKLEAWLNGGKNPEMGGFLNGVVAGNLDEGYYIDNYHATAHVCQTDTIGRTAVRGPGEIQASFLIETIIEHVAAETGVDAMKVRELNLYPENDEAKLVTAGPDPSPLTHYTLPRLWRELKQSADWDKLTADVEAFNKANRWKKRGVAMTPVRYKVSAGHTSALVNVYHDGSVMISHGGCDVGQGMQIKIAQVAATTLGRLVGAPLPLDRFRFIESDSRFIPNMGLTGGSTQSEMSAEAVRTACEQLVERFQSIRADLEKGGQPVTWEAICGKTDIFGAEMNSGVQASSNPRRAYNNYGAGLSVVELDVLTGETTVLRSDINYDCGVSLNPAIDIGQCEGGFVQGLGFFLREKVYIDDEGRCLSNSTWSYKVPSVADVPLEFNVTLSNNPDFDKGFLSSKASGEPPLVLACSAHVALRHAIAAARADAGEKGFFKLDSPALPETNLKLAGTKELKL